LAASQRPHGPRRPSAERGNERTYPASAEGRRRLSRPHPVGQPL